VLAVASSEKNIQINFLVHNLKSELKRRLAPLIC